MKEYLKSILPHEILSKIGNREMIEVSTHSKSTVYRIGEDYYLKIDERHALQEEVAMNRFLNDFHMGSKEIAYICADRDYFLTKALRGKAIHEQIQDPFALSQSYGRALRKFHESLPTSSLQRLSPAFSLLLDLDLSDLRVNPDYLLKGFELEVEDVWELVEARKELNRDYVIHSDPCLSNLIDDGTEARFIDLAGVGLGDRSYDLYWAIWSLSYNLGSEAFTDSFLDAYGRDWVEMDKIKLIAFLTACEMSERK